MGDTLETLTSRPIDRVQIVRYAAASGDFDPMHIDEIAAREAGMPSVHAHSMMAMGYAGRMVTRWQGAGSHLEHLSARFIKIVWPGDQIVCHGRVAELTHEEGCYCAGLELWGENRKGELVFKGSARVRLFHSVEDEARQARGEGPVVLGRASSESLQDRIGAPMARSRKRQPRAGAGGAAAKAAKKPVKKAAAKAAKKPAKKAAAKAAKKPAKKAAAK
ncbi:MAG: MaoC/PaaZ C-terminal domain-containing protein, partial [Deltaproteobacteria bacterium]|nr:MaoC/PaaZ C-terminal domain-containing protein [Deltaproteobacteria bacterium]